MDSLSQFALGSSLSLAVLGRAIGPRKAAVLGGVLATLPDLDVFYPFDNPIDSFVLHRSISHSVLVLSLAAPLLAIACKPLFKQAVSTTRLVIAFWLCLVTHPLLDAMTIYGTQLLWPLSTHPFAVGSVFIVDPAYTLPLLIVTIIALTQSQWKKRLAQGTVLALAVSTLYLGWSVFAQRMIEARAYALDAPALNVTAERTLWATPMPFSTLFWRILELEENHYTNTYLTVLADPAKQPKYRHLRIDPDSECALSLHEVQRIQAFSHGYFALLVEGEEIHLADLRMGITPNYAFQFKVAEKTPSGITETEITRITGPRQYDGDLAWLLDGIAGQTKIRAAEAGSLVAEPAPIVQVQADQTTCLDLVKPS